MDNDTHIPLRDYIDTRFRELEKRLDLAFKSTSGAMENAEAAHKNVENGLKRLEDRMLAAEKRSAAHTGVGQGMSQLWGLVVSGVSAMAAVIASLTYFYR